MALLTAEHTPNYHRKPAAREYLYFAIALIALLLVAGARLEFSSNTEAGNSKDGIAAIDGQRNPGDEVRRP